MKIREEASAILGIRIEPNGWDKAILNLDTAGMVTRKRLMELLVMTMKRIEQIEDGKDTNSSV